LTLVCLLPPLAAFIVPLRELTVTRTDKRSYLLHYPDTHPHLDVERGPNDKGVGSWVPNNKHRYLADFIQASHGARANWPHRVYIDLFSGPGRVQVEGESATRDGGALVAWRQGAIQPNAQFTKMLIADKEPTRVHACCARLEAAGATVEGFPGVAAETVDHVLDRVPRRSFCLAYLDPYNLQFLSFEIIKKLATLQTIDFAVHFSTMDLARNVDMEFRRGRFDDTAPGWSQAIDPSTMARSSVREAFFDYWCGLIKGLCFEFSEKMPLITSDRKAPIYRLVFFSRHPLANRLWSDVARSPNGELF
tara:strand:- start:3368 stop:4285 length:918 start_codon:yes stop_codon:yes gene_type:complete